MSPEERIEFDKEVERETKKLEQMSDQERDEHMNKALFESEATE